MMAAVFLEMRARWSEQPRSFCNPLGADWHRGSWEEKIVRDGQWSTW